MDPSRFLLMNAAAETLRKLLSRLSAGEGIQPSLDCAKQGLRKAGVCSVILLGISKDNACRCFVLSSCPLGVINCQELLADWKDRTLGGAPFMISLEENTELRKAARLPSRAIGWVFPVAMASRSGYVIFAFSPSTLQPSPKGLSEIANCLAIAYVQEHYKKNAKAARSRGQELEAINRSLLPTSPEIPAIEYALGIMAKALKLRFVAFYASSPTGGTQLKLISFYPKNLLLAPLEIDCRSLCNPEETCDRCDRSSGIPRCIKRIALGSPELQSPNELYWEAVGIRWMDRATSSAVCTIASSKEGCQGWGMVLASRSSTLGSLSAGTGLSFLRSSAKSISRSFLKAPFGEGGTFTLEPKSIALFRQNSLFSGGRAVRISWEIRDAETWLVRSISENASAIGYRPSELIGQNFAEIVHVEDLDRLRAEVVELLEKGSTCWEQRYRIVGANGEVRHIYDYTRSVGVTNKGFPFYLDGLLLEVTGEVEVRANWEKAMQDLKWFTYAASHDLKEPTNTIVGRLRMAQREIERLVGKMDGGGTTSELKESLVGGGSRSIGYLVGRSLLAAKRLGDLTDDLLSYSRISRHEPELAEVESGEAIADALDGLAEAIETSGAQVEILSVLPRIYCDRYKFEMLIQNLVENSIKFAKPNAPPEIFISCQLQSVATSTSSLIHSQQRQAWRFTVADNGIGFDSASDGDRVFQPFSRLHSPEDYEGAGIGLASCEKIVSLWEGKIWAESVPGEGASFSFTVPSPPGIK